MRDGASWSGGEINHLWLNLGGTDYVEVSGVSGTDSKKDSRSFSLLDFDGDGWQDFVLVNANAPYATLYRNRIGEMLPAGARSAPLRVRFRGGNRGSEPAPGWSPRDGYGAKLRITAGGRTLVREFRCGEGLSAQNSATLTVGIGDAARAERIEVVWPSGRVTVVEDVAAGSLLEFHEDPSETADGSGVAIGAPAQAVAVAASVAPQPLERDVELAGLLDGRSDAPFRLVTTWFKTCAACKKAAPTLHAIADAVPSERLAIFGFNNELGDSAREMESYMETYRPAWTNLEQRRKDDVEALKALLDRHLKPRRADGRRIPASEQTPCTLLFDAGGDLLWAGYGVPTLSQVLGLLEQHPASGT